MTEMEKSRQPWNGETGLINQEMLERHVKGMASPIYYIAGPPALVTAMRETLVSAGAEGNDIRTDEFVGY